jgi:alanine-synthesizing transaminase
VLSRQDVLVCALGGLSKSVGLPQLKLGWIALAGPSEAVGRALDRLEIICDTYLSVSTPVQLAARELLDRGAVVRAQIASRIVSNYRRLTDRAASLPSASVLRADAGWYAVVQVPTFRSEEDLVVDLVSTSGVLTHPGYFFDFPRESYLIVSLLPPADTFAEGVDIVFGAAAFRLQTERAMTSHE